MQSLFGGLKCCGLAAGLLLLCTGMGCKPVRQSNGATAATATATATNTTGRFQLVVAQMGERGTMVFMLDTRDGATWFFQPPQGALINGFWSNVPRLTFGDQYWEQVMRQMLTPQPAASAPGASSLTSTQRMSSVPSLR